MATRAVGNFVHCRDCGSEIARSAVSCPQCGGRQRSGAGKSKIAAGFIALFLGGLGIHRFYLGQWWGLFYLLFCWTFIPAVIALVEAIVFFCTSDEAWEQKYG
ncbi:MAG TPA: TM2 domain-containing protein [Allosphingosinicella sp.]|uniref:TM2 domain-containing protein n=1 Tax=Allosphingosinicella sp. TaxID=2823234 RepID=UPI002EDB8B3D